MYLKSIEIQGFKSFPDRTELTFSPGVTAIVGPNGSGKSNIVDAIRWVLGEQSTKTLRGGKMEDVIFGGTKKRTPQGFCEVSLTLDNEGRTIPLDYSEITITRRYYRSGESEFFINRKSVRLKDIHELFMDTGLGRDGYSIIGQGRIDEILSVKSADRREIFEEAAGISKGRYRKEESERKLAQAEENLIRIRDIITELEGRVEPLKRQAETAKRFLLLRDELRVLEVSSWLDSLGRLSEAAQKAQTDFDNAERLLSAKKSELEAIYQKSESLSAEMRGKDAELEGLRLDLERIQERESALRSEMAVNAANIKNNEENILSRTQEMDAESQKESSLLSQRQARINRLEEIERAEQAARKALEELNIEIELGRMQSADLSAKADALSAQIQLEMQNRAQINADIRSAEASGEEIGVRKGQLAQEIGGLEADIAARGDVLASVKARIEEQEDKKQSAQNMLRGFELRQKARQSKVDELSKALEELKREQGTKEDRLNLLQAMERDYEGFPGPVRKVMQAKGKGLSGIHGPLSSLIKTDDEYSTAIEIALGAAMQNIVVDDEGAAKTAIGYLKSNDYGRATFLPITSVKARDGKRRELAGERGFCAYACDVLTYDRKYDDIVRSFLGNTVLADNIDSAIALGKKYGYAFRIVTLDGQLIATSGAMTGGSLNRSAGILSRANEQDSLKARLKELGEEIGEKQGVLGEAARELKDVTYQSQVATDELREAENALVALNAENGQHLSAVQDMEQRLEARAEDLRQADSRMGEMVSAVTRSAEALAATEEMLAALSAELDTLTGGMSLRTQEKGLLEERASEGKAAIAALLAEKESISGALAELVLLIESLAGEKQNRLSVIEAVKIRNAELEKTVAGQQELLNAILTESEDKRGLIKSITEEKLRLEGERNRADKESQARNNEILNQERERARLENKKSQTRMEEAAILDRLWENYELTRVTAAEIYQTAENPAKQNRRIGELRGEIKSLGNVNLGAIEEYQEVAERYEFMAAQRDDLEKAKGDLLNIINDLTRSMEETFAEQFKLINTAFDETFRDIFGGGSAYLILEDEKDILNCGIEIKVELPGKNTRVISLLSGGEKAFVAIALYFAIIKVRPTPFCVLDEIEAALDDVNVTRFSDYMRTLCDKTQFIAITHRRGTMEGSDILYGVTMQEQGVTKLLALNISDVEKQVNVRPN